MLPRWLRWLGGGRNNDRHEDHSPVEDRSTIEELSRKEMPFRWGPYTLMKIKDADAQAPHELNPELPSEVEEITLKALARDPAGRPTFLRRRSRS